MKWWRMAGGPQHVSTGTQQMRLEFSVAIWMKLASWSVQIKADGTFRVVETVAGILL